MKWKIEKKYLRIAGTTLGIIILAILFNNLLEHEGRLTSIKNTVRGTMAPIVIGCILAYLLNPILNFFEHYCFISEKRGYAKEILPGIGNFMYHSIIFNIGCGWALSGYTTGLFITK